MGHYDEEYEEYERKKYNKDMYLRDKYPEKIVAPELLKTEEKVNHPHHYNIIPKIECIDVVEHLNFNKGNAIKYIWRAGSKDKDCEIQDLEKAKWYIEREIQRIKNGKN